MKISKSKKIFLLVGILIILGATIVYANAGTKDDPLVSLSYFNENATYQVVNLSAGQTLIGEGGTEIILRGGTKPGVGPRAEIVASGVNGLSNITTAKDLKNGELVPLNNLLIVPRSDGRGVKATTDTVYLVKGQYEIQ